MVDRAKDVQSNPGSGLPLAEASQAEIKANVNSYGQVRKPIVELQDTCCERDCMMHSQLPTEN